MPNKHVIATYVTAIVAFHWSTNDLFWWD